MVRLGSSGYRILLVRIVTYFVLPLIISLFCSANIAFLTVSVRHQLPYCANQPCIAQRAKKSSRGNTVIYKVTDANKRQPAERGSVTLLASFLSLPLASLLPNRHRRSLLVERGDCQHARVIRTRARCASRPCAPRFGTRGALRRRLSHRRRILRVV